MEVIKGRFEFAIYENDENGYCVYRYRNIDTEKVFCATGYGLPSAPGLTVRLEGEWQRNDKYRNQSLNVSVYELEMPVIEKEFIKYVKSLHVGIGATTAKSLWKKFGAEVWATLEQEPEKLLEVRNVSKTRLQRLQNAISEQQVVHRLYLLVNEYVEGATLHKLITLASALGPGAAEEVEKNPYTLCRFGFSFHNADRLARALNFAPDAAVRMTSGMYSVLNRAASNGHVCIPKEMFQRESLKTLNAAYKPELPVTEETFRSAAKKLRDDPMHGLRFKGGMVYTSLNYKEEKGVAEHLLRLKNAKDTDADRVMQLSLDDFLKEYRHKSGMDYAEAQINAVKQAIYNHISIVTGGPGTGKTSVIKAIIAAFSALQEHCEPLLLAPTGRAARRMEEQTGVKAQTIHSALELNEASGYVDPALQLPLDASLIVVDEVSMLDEYLAYQLFARISTGCFVVLVGDADQLPSVGAGNVLHEMLRSGDIPVTRLQVIFRQAQDNPIVPNAAKIREGKTDLISDPKKFRIFDISDPTRILQKACALYVHAVEARGIDNVILLTPFREKGENAVSIFNRQLQHHLNPPKAGEETFSAHGTEFRIGDKVMQIKNTQGPKNGDIGYVRDIIMRPKAKDSTELEKCCKIEFNGEMVYCGKGEMSNIELAYACTVHKSQGSEFSVVIFVATEEHAVLLQRNLIYTAITRAADTVAFVGEYKALQAGVADASPQRRYTLLGDYLHYYSQKDKELKKLAYAQQ